MSILPTTTACGWWPQNEKIMVSRTLSKSYALAGLRFGFLVAQPHVIEQLVKVKDSYNCDSLSIAGGHGRHRRSGLAGRQSGQNPRHPGRLDRRNAGLGFASVDSQANFVWNPHPTLPVRPLYEQLKAEQILVRYMDYAGWGDGLRISVGSDDQIDACLACSRRWCELHLSSTDRLKTGSPVLNELLTADERRLQTDKRSK